jgi:trichothecene 3-O-acetyltransferase
VQLSGQVFAASTIRNYLEANLRQVQHVSYRSYLVRSPVLFTKRMASAATDLDITLDVFGQRLVAIFTQISFCFANPDGAEADEIANVLSRGLNRLAQSFPWLAGQVVCQGAAEGNTGVFKIVSLETTPRMTIRDERNNGALSWELLEASGFSMNYLDEDLVAPRKSYSGKPGETVAEVLQLQATLLKGGVIVTFLGQHQAMDGTGLATAMRLFSQACQGEDFSEDVLHIGNLAPENTIRLLDHAWQPGLELSHNIVKEDRSQGPGSCRAKTAYGPCVWAHFSLSAPALAALKKQATSTLPVAASASYISTDDALTAFVMQAIARIRLPRFDAATEMLCARAVDLRRYLHIPPTHPGFVQSMTYHRMPLHQAATGPLGGVAVDFRRALADTAGLTYHGRSFATLISRTPDKTQTSYIAGFDMARDVMISSWANQDAYCLDFGLGLGKPSAVRRPRFDSFPGLVYLLPKEPAGGIGVAICLLADEMEALKKDADLANFASYSG